jgi:hypothetical protein
MCKMFLQDSVYQLSSLYYNFSYEMKQVQLCFIWNLMDEIALQDACFIVNMV